MAILAATFVSVVPDNLYDIINCSNADTRPPIHLLHRIKSILCCEEEGPFPMNEMDHKFGIIVFFSKQYKILEIRKCYSMALVITFDIPEIVSPGTYTDYRIFVKVEKM